MARFRAIERARMTHDVVLNGEVVLVGEGVAADEANLVAHRREPLVEDAGLRVVERLVPLEDSHRCARLAAARREPSCTATSCPSPRGSACAASKTAAVPGSEASSTTPDAQREARELGGAVKRPIRAAQLLAAIRRAIG
jgi:hypothetical protein